MAISFRKFRITCILVLANIIDFKICIVNQLLKDIPMKIVNMPNFYHFLSKKL